METISKLTFGTLNANGFTGCNGKLRLDECLEMMKKEDIAILGICESKEADGKEMEMKTDDYLWIGKQRKSVKGFGRSPGTRQAEVSGGGVGFLFKKELEQNMKTLKGWEEDDDVLWIQISGVSKQLPLTIGLVYISPDRRDNAKEGVEKLLGKIVAKAEEYSQSAMVMIMGDLNFDLNRDADTPYTQSWKNIIEELNMELVDSRGDLATRPTRYPPQTTVDIAPSHLDYIMIGKQWSHLVSNERFLERQTA